MVQSQVPDIRFIGAVSTALRFNEIEILSWCYGVYLLLVLDKVFFKMLRRLWQKETHIQFRRLDELVVSCAIFAKILNNLES